MKTKKYPPNAPVSAICCTNQRNCLDSHAIFLLLLGRAAPIPRKPYLHDISKVTFTMNVLIFARQGTNEIEQNQQPTKIKTSYHRHSMHARNVVFSSHPCA